MWAGFEERRLRVSRVPFGAGHVDKNVVFVEHDERACLEEPRAKKIGK